MPLASMCVGDARAGSRLSRPPIGCPMDETCLIHAIEGMYIDYRISRGRPPTPIMPTMPDVQGVPIGTVMSRLARARVQIKRYLDGESPALPPVK
jgi:hypothetical protein